MSTLKAEELRQENPQELEARVLTLRKEIYHLRSEKLENRNKETHLIGKKRKEIARILTVINEKKRS